MMAAIEASQIGMVKLIISYQFTHLGEQRADHKLNFTDDKGNNVLHFAYKRAAANIYPILLEAGMGNPNSRNHRGLLPKEMSH